MFVFKLSYVLGIVVGYVIEPDSGGGGASASGQPTSAQLPNNPSTSADVTPPPVTPSAEELRKKRLAFLDKTKTSGTTDKDNSQQGTTENDETKQNTDSETKSTCDEHSEKVQAKQPGAKPKPPENAGNLD